MPFYEYECQACKFYTEVMQKISDAPLTKCPSCGKRALKKLVSAPVFRLKGGGWYETDFKSDKENKRNLVGADKEEAQAETPRRPKPSPSKAEGQGREAAKTKDGNGRQGHGKEYPPRRSRRAAAQDVRGRKSAALPARQSREAAPRGRRT